jgi:hemoglobin
MRLAIGAKSAEMLKINDETVSLYERMGGESGVERLIDAFYSKVLADVSLAPFFAATPMDKLRAMQKEFFSMALGGPVTYSGRPLSHVHHGRGITKTHFGNFVQHLIETLKEIGVSQEDADKVIEHVNTFTNEVTGASY